MIIRNLDANHDWTFGQGKSNYLTGDAAIGLNLETEILSWLGDCFFDTLAGIDWINRLGSKNQRTLLETDLRRLILTSYGVTGLTQFDTLLNGRAFGLNAAINTIFSQAYALAVAQGEAPNAG